MTKTPSDPPLDMDALLAQTPESAPAESSSEPVEETPAQRRIRELEAELEKPAPVYEAPEPFRPTSQLTPEERTIRELEDKVARKKAAEQEAAPIHFQAPEADDGVERILLHFLVDGVTVGGVVWYRGQEVEYVVGSAAYEQTKDRNGDTWLSLVNDTAGQFARWGKQIFAPGPWPGKRWDDFSHLTDPEEIQAAQRAAEAERRRGRAAPLIY